MATPDEPSEPRVFEPPEDEPIRLPKPWITMSIALGLDLASAALVFVARRHHVEPLTVALFVFGASFVAPCLATLTGKLAMDRVVPFAVALALAAEVAFQPRVADSGFHVAIEFGADTFFFAGRELGAILRLLTLVGIPVATIMGALLGAFVKGRNDDERGSL